MKKNVFAFALALLTAASAWAYDFKSGDLCYNITDEAARTVEVTYSYDNYTSLSGAITIPATVSYNGINYSVTSIESGAFQFCSALTQVTLPNSVTSIGDGAFYNCSALTQVTIGNSVTSIGYEAFEGTALYNNADNWTNNVLYIDNCLIRAKTELSGNYEIAAGTRVIASEAFSECSALTQVTIPDGVTSIGEGAFSDCSALTQVTLPDGVTSIGEGAFSDCSALTQVTLPDGVTSIGEYAFSRCFALTQVTIGNSVESIGNYAFEGCSALTQVTIPESVTSIGSSAFSGCSKLASIRCEATTPPALGSDCFYDTSFAIVFIPTGTKDTYTTAWGSSYTYIEGEGVELTVHVETPGGLTGAIVAKGHMPAAVNKLTVTGTLNDDDFSIIKNNMTSLYDLDISGITNTTLPEAVFSRKKTLLQIDLPTQLTAIPENAFEDCLIFSITIPESVTSIGWWAFEGCTSLTQVTIPNSVTSIGNYAFSDCSSLTQVTIGNSVTSIGSSAFEGCSALTQVSIPNSVTSIGSGAFSDCSSLTQVSIPNSVTSIGRGAFYYCSALTSVIIGNHVETISSNAFSRCSNLDTITCLGSNPPAVSQSFETIDPKTCKLYVPKTALMNYIQAPVWGAFLNMEGIDVPTETYLLNLRIGQGGSISHNGNVYTANSTIEVLPEATTTLQIQATPGYEIGSVSFNGTDYTAQLSEDGTLTLPALTENATLQVSFTQQSYTVAYYVAGSNAYFFTTVNYGETFRCHAAAAEGHSILSVTLNGTDITGQLGEDGLLEITNITENCTLIISTDAGQTTETTGTQQDAAAFRAWQSNGEVFVEHTQDMTGVALYDVNGRLLHQTGTDGYGVLRMTAPGKIHIVRATYADGTTASQKVM